jgi:hypothetical protein
VDAAKTIPPYLDDTITEEMAERRKQRMEAISLRLMPQSDEGEQQEEHMVTMDTNMPGTVETDETTALYDYPVSKHMNRTDEYFSRPVRIYQFSWLAGNSVSGIKINPWNLFMEAGGVQSRWERFGYFRGKLHVRFLVNGSPYSYGRLFALYEPLYLSNDYDTEGPSGANAKLLRTARHHVLLNPTNSEGADMVLPFFYNMPYASLIFRDYDLLGQIEFFSLTTLKTINNSPLASNCHISLYAWMEDMEIFGPTTMLPQSDEYTGVVSKPASAVASFSKMLSDLPYIGPFARATSMVASGVGAMASLLGYGKPTALEYEVMQPVAATAMATGVGTDGVHKLTFDPKQELSIDPEIVGIQPDDQMALSTIFRRWCVVGTLDWTTSQTSGSTVDVWEVRPDTLIGETSGAVYMPPLAHAANGFTFWRGSIEYKMIVVTSNFHRGRLLVQYDPIDTPTRTPSTVSDYQSTQSHIIDLAQTNELSIRVGMVGAFWRRVGEGDVFGSTVDTYTNAERLRNGVIRVAVLTPLTGGDGSTNVDVSIIVYARGGPDMEFSVMNDRIATFTLNSKASIQPVGFDEPLEPQSDMACCNMPAPQPSTAEVWTEFGGPVSSDGRVNVTNIGETVVSLREILKRYCFERVLTTAPAGASAGLLDIVWSLYRYNTNVGPTLVSSVFTVPLGDSVYSDPSPTHPIWYYGCGYVGSRGQVRKMFVSHPENGETVLKVSYNNENGPNGVSQALINDVSSSTGRQAHVNSFYLGNGSTGSALTHSGVNPVLKAEIPQMGPGLFAPTKEDWNVAGGIGTYNLHIITKNQNRPVAVDVYSALGEDFTFLYYLGAPVLYRRDDGYAKPTLNT